MKKSTTIIIFLTFAVAVVFLLVFSLTKPKLKTGKVCFQNNCFEVEIASNPQEQERGLMFRDHLDKNKGILFIFDAEGLYPFWMKNTLIPLDMVWINQNKEIVFIKKNALPCRKVDCPMIDPDQNAKYVLEVNGGMARDINLKVGDEVTFSGL